MELIEGPLMVLSSVQVPRNRLFQCKFLMSRTIVVGGYCMDFSEQSGALTGERSVMDIDRVHAQQHGIREVVQTVPSGLAQENLYRPLHRNNARRLPANSLLIYHFFTLTNLDRQVSAS
jgi:hypothetical protein